MPISNGAIGRPGILAIPGRAGTSFTFQDKRFRSPPLAQTSVYITGTALVCAGGAPLPFARVMLFRTWNSEFVGETTADGAGNFSILAPGSGPFFLVAYLAGSPDVAGTTVNTLIPA